MRYGKSLDWISVCVGESTHCQGLSSFRWGRDGVSLHYQASINRIKCRVQEKCIGSDESYWSCCEDCLWCFYRKLRSIFRYTTWGLCSWSNNVLKLLVKKSSPIFSEVRTVKGLQAVSGLPSILFGRPPLLHIVCNVAYNCSAVTLHVWTAKNGNKKKANKSKFVQPRFISRATA